MARPIETLLSLPRVRLVNRVPILETEQYIRRFVNQTPYRPRLVRHALEVAQASAQHFSADERGLSTLLNEVGSVEYVVTQHSQDIMEAMLGDICDDGLIFKRFEGKIEPLFDESQALRQVSKLAESLADKTKEESFDIARALMIHLPTSNKGFCAS